MIVRTVFGGPWQIRAALSVTWYPGGRALLDQASCFFPFFPTRVSRFSFSFSIDGRERLEVDMCLSRLDLDVRLTLPAVFVTCGGGAVSAGKWRPHKPMFEVRGRIYKRGRLLTLVPSYVPSRGLRPGLGCGGHRLMRHALTLLAEFLHLLPIIFSEYIVHCLASFV